VLELGNLRAKRDWGYAPEYCEGMWKMLQLDKPEDFVLATGETHTVKEFVEVAFRELGIPIAWKGKGANEKGVSKKTGRTLVTIDPRYYRPTEVDLLIGDASKARRRLGWSAKTKFDELARLMVKADFDLVSKRGF
jgi:GDPmannose 4,6-dehydratase